MKLPVEKTRPFANPMRFERASPASRAWIVRFGARERVRGAVECDGSVSRSRVARLRRGAVWRGVARGMADLDEVRVVLLDPRVLALQRIDGLDVFDRLARAPAGLGVSLVHDRVGLARDLREEVESPTDERGRDEGHERHLPVHPEGVADTTEHLNAEEDALAELEPEALLHGRGLLGDLGRELGRVVDVEPRHVLAQHRLEVHLAPVHALAMAGEEEERGVDPRAHSRDDAGGHKHTEEEVQIFSPRVLRLAGNIQKVAPADDEVDVGEAGHARGNGRDRGEEPVERRREAE
mmetsp:Transcript_45426/g.125326  ORF Transcript_45426/g.125326 Transcript_45426/m.125326 type:complete len:294 (-) Transcript_45426:222-1103(-)